MFIVELTTTTGAVCERHATYEEARRRVDQFPAQGLVGMPLIFQELPDGSQRLVREDGKPLQWHRLPEDRPPFKGRFFKPPSSAGPVRVRVGGTRVR